VITLTLLHPVQLTPIQHWTFDESEIVRIGRSTENQVVLYSAVVSRYHAEIRRANSAWEIVSLGANGTYLDGKRITQVPVRDGMIIRLARSGPNLQIHLGRSTNLSSKPTTEFTKISGMRSLDDERTQAFTGDTRSTPTARTSMDTDRGSDFRAVEPDPTDPSRIGKYSEVELIREGRIGMTYAGKRNGQSFILKTLNPQWINHPRALALFERQASVLQPVNHPGVPRSLDFFRVRGQPYFVTEAVSGKTVFQQVRQQGKVEIKQAIAWMLEVCEILDYLHTQPLPVLHQDVRPENLIRRDRRTSSYELALVEFGMTRGLENDPSELRGANRFTSGYLAPEQQNGQATFLSDLYGVGTTLAFLISGHQPRLFYKQWQQESRFSPELIPGLLPELIEVLGTLTAPNPRDRYQSAREVASGLREIG
jgi:serine/threonine protein kinase